MFTPPGLNINTSLQTSPPFYDTQTSTPAIYSPRMPSGPYQNDG
jgi:hypothetical protein